MASLPFRVKALYDYSSPHDDDLSFSNNQIITVTDEEDADWYFGKYEDSNGKQQEGLFPRNFVQLYEPETPPRPTRSSRPKKETESPIAPAEAEEVPGTGVGGPGSPRTAAPPPPEVFNETQHPTEHLREAEVPKSAPPPPKANPSAPPPTNANTKPTPSNASKPAPPPVSEKPSSSSFRDRINAFNKPAAPPVAPMKPSGLGGSSGSSFIKKPFVAPPPSKNAYVPPPREPPPQKLYRREEDPEISSRVPGYSGAGDQSIPQAAPSTDESEDQPKPTSLKDRIALLQKQQMEQAARHAEAGQKKERPKRPSKKHADPEVSLADQDDLENEGLERMGSGDTLEKRISMDASRDNAPARSRSITKPRKSREDTPVASPAPTTSREPLSDGNEADQSGAGDTEGDEASTAQDDSDEKPRGGLFFPQRPPQAPPRKLDAEENEDNVDEGEEGEEEEEVEEEVDPEVKRRMEIRERMAKMSGGMGMAGMFGPPAGLPPRTTKQGSGSNDRKASGSSAHAVADTSSSRAPFVPLMPMPGMHNVRSPEQTEGSPVVEREDVGPAKSIIQGRAPDEMPDVEDLQEDPVPRSRRSTDRAAPPPIPQGRPVPAPPGEIRAAPSVPSERPVPPPPPSASRPVPPPPPSQFMSPSEGSESDDELSSHTKTMSLDKASEPDDSRPISQEGPPQLSPTNAPPSLPSRPAAPQSRLSIQRPGSFASTAKDATAGSPTIGVDSQKRSSRVPPIPGSSLAMPSVPQSRAPPPPPPSGAPPSRTSTGNLRAPPGVPRTQGPEDNDEEVTEYDGDYDTDIAPGATHKDALKSHGRVSSLEDDSMTEEKSLHHSGLPSLGPPPSSAPRAIPPPPPNQPPRSSRQSSDMPRAAPPPPPPPPPKEPAYEEEDDYDPFVYKAPVHRGTGSSRGEDVEVTMTPQFETSDFTLPTSPSQYSSTTNMPVLDRPAFRQSSDIQRVSTSIRKSTDVSRPSAEQDFMAIDVELSQGSFWWTKPNAPPPIFQNRRDVNFEIEEKSTTKRGGKQAVTREIYVLYMDYSQTIVTAHFEANDPTIVTLEQRHEAPPRALRQDQLEEAHTKIGSHIAEGANSKKETVVRDGTPHALPLDLISALPDALRPVGVRAYGALVYANMANASVQQFDEIRPGDIVTFRNSKFQGHRGPMHSKYSIEVGKPDHVGVVFDWDGTKKKVRAWEQGREGKKVKMESFKFGDMRSGEVKVWRVMSRSWVGWQGQK